MDAETGLMYYRHRVYHAGLGRFGSRDPVRYEGDSLSLQQCGRGNPISFVDPLGLEDLGKKWKVPDFFWWYYFGKGKDVPLDQVGLLKPWWNHIKPQGYNDLKRKMLPELESRLDCCSGNTSGTFDVAPFSIHVVAGGGIHNPLTVMGNSWVKVSGRCSVAIDCVKCCDGSVKVSTSRGNCSLDFSVRDIFQNPLDKGGYFGKDDWPGATPYNLVASWFHVYTWSIDYNPCPENR